VGDVLFPSFASRPSWYKLPIEQWEREYSGPGPVGKGDESVKMELKEKEVQNESDA